MVIYSRYSTDEQNPRTIEDQVAACRSMLKELGLDDCEIVEHSDSGVSGEFLRRPGIDKVLEDIELRQCDLIIASDASRFYRHSTASMGFHEAAVDQGIRVISVNDRIDTIDPEWRLSAFFTSFRNELANRDTKKRIHNAMNSRWRDGFAVYHCKPGYTRIPTTPATATEPERGPFRHVKDERWTEVIKKAFEMVAQGEPFWRVGKFLDSEGFPKSVKSKLPNWTDLNVRKFINDPVYSGRETFRKTTKLQKFVTGRSVQVETPEDEVLWREMHHLAHVSRSLQMAAIKAASSRRRHHVSLRGSKAAHAGIPRDRRGPLSQHFFCGYCGAIMYRCGSSYACSESFRKPTTRRKDGAPCPNRCRPKPHIVHRKISKAIVEALIGVMPALEPIMETVHRYLREGDGIRNMKLKQLRDKESMLKRRCANLGEKIELGHQSDTLVRLLSEREAELGLVRSEIEDLNAEPVNLTAIPTAKDIQERIENLKPQLLESMGADAGPILRRLVTPIRAVPVMLIDSKLPKLRAEFSVQLVELLPDSWRHLLVEGTTAHELGLNLASMVVPVSIELFEIPKRIQFAKPAAEQQANGLTTAQIARELTIPVWQVEDALHTRRRMKELGLEVPIYPVTDWSDIPTQWRRNDDRVSDTEEPHGTRRVHLGRPGSHCPPLSFRLSPALFAEGESGRQDNS